MPRVHLTAIKTLDLPASLESVGLDLGHIDADSPFLVVRMPKGAEAVTPEAMHAAFDGLALIVVVVPDGYELHWGRCVEEPAS